MKEFKATAAAAVLVQKKLRIPESSRTIVLRVDDADLAMAKVLEAFAPPVIRPAPGIDPQARIDPSAQIGADVSIGAFAVISARCSHRPGIDHPSAWSISGRMWRSARIAKSSRNVTIRERIQIGSRVIIHAGSVLGTDGFGYRWDGNKQAKIPQIGTVIIEDDVEIGSCVCIDRAKFSVDADRQGNQDRQPGADRP